MSPERQKMIEALTDELVKILEILNLKLISFSLMDPNKADGDVEKFIFIHRPILEDLLKMSEGQVKH